jgi:very-short-patch-repair endonuclease
VTHELLARGAVALLPGAVVTGRSAAVLWGLDLAGPQDDVEVTLAPETHMRRINGLRTRRAILDPAHTWYRRGVPTTSPETTAARLAADLSEDAAVAAVDQLIQTEVVDLVGIRRHAQGLRGPGAARARRVAALADGLAQSPQETRVRLLIGRSHLPTPLAQFAIRDATGVMRLDFAWPEHKVALEYDGLWHADNRQFAKDRHRLNRLRAAGWQVVFVTAAMLYEPEKLIAMIAAALAASSLRG